MLAGIISEQDARTTGLKIGMLRNLLHYFKLATPVEAACDKQLNKRLEDIQTGKTTGEPLNQVLSELREKYS